jgi:ketosteroid isomerase-like protein
VEVRATAPAAASTAITTACAFVVADGRIAAIREYLDSDHSKRMLFPDLA